MDVDALLVKLARTICCARARCEGCNGSGEGGCFDFLLWNEEARAALRVVVGPLMEDTADQCQTYADWHNKMDDGLSGFDKMALGAEECAENIRARAAEIERMLGNG